MSESITVHLRGVFRFDNLRSCLEQLVGHPFLQVNDAEWNLYHTTCFGLGLSIYESQDFEDDCNIPFTEYAFVVSIDRVSDVVETEHALSLQELVGRVVARSCCNALQCQCVIVRNSQHVIASYSN